MESMPQLLRPNGVKKGRLSNWRPTLLWTFETNTNYCPIESNMPASKREWDGFFADCVSHAYHDDTYAKEFGIKIGDILASVEAQILC